MWASGHTYFNFGKWPCSELSGKRLFAEFDTNGLLDIAINSSRGSQDCSSDEFNAITSDYISTKLSKEHPCYFITVEQFKQ